MRAPVHDATNHYCRVHSEVCSFAGYWSYAKDPTAISVSRRHSYRGMYAIGVPCSFNPLLKSISWKSRSPNFKLCPNLSHFCYWQTVSNNETPSHRGTSRHHLFCDPLWPPQSHGSSSSTSPCSISRRRDAMAVHEIVNCGQNCLKISKHVRLAVLSSTYLFLECYGTLYAYLLKSLS